MEQINNALNLFLFLSVELSALFILISFIVGILQHKIPAKKIQSALGHGRLRSYFIAAGFATLTPFCSCSTIPMLRGMLRAGVGFGPMMTFLFVSPLLNPIIIGLLFVTFGWQLTVVYSLSALVVSLFSSFILEKLNFQKHIIQDETITLCASQPTCSISSNNSQSQSCCDSKDELTMIQPTTPYKKIWIDALKDFKKIIPYLFIGIAIGSVIYGFVPTDLLSKYAGNDNPFAIPVAAVIGIPLYIRAEAVIPLASVLLTKGVGAGTVLALIIGSAGASLTELILLRTLFRYKLILAFVCVILGMALIAGYTTYLIY
mgnify:FL=1